MPAVSSSHIVRRAIRIEGAVLGVGFRPAIARLARSLGLVGCARTDDDAVALEVEGSAAAVARFLDELSRHAPPQARIDSIEHIEVAPRGDSFFDGGDALSLEGAPAVAAAVDVGPVDAAPCDDCVRDMLDPFDRHHRNPFVSCRACGPRFAILETPPFSRATSTMNAFVPCADCAREYADASADNRRYQAETLACRACGPKLTFLPTEARGDDAVQDTVRALKDGLIVAVKAAGCFVLLCDAANEDAVKKLRQRKRRPEKPFAVLARDLARADQLVVVEGAARRALTSPARPIVLAPRASSSPGLAPNVAPGLAELGVCLPSTPLLALLAHDSLLDLVVASGNPTHEPPAVANEDAIARLSGIADAFLFHDRDIRRVVDDSIVRAFGSTSVVPVRRGRGQAPDPFALTVARDPMPAVLAVGSDDDNAVCFAAAGRAIVAPRVCDVGGASFASGSLVAPFAALGDVVVDVEHVLAQAPELVAHDLDPDARTSRFAQDLAGEKVAVAHHHAHIASCLVDNGRADRVLAVVLDHPAPSTESAGPLWGGDLFLADLLGCARVGGLRPLALPGGRPALRAPWRLAVSALVDAALVDAPRLRAGPAAVGARIDAEQIAAVRAILANPSCAPSSSSADAWIAAVASLCGLCDKESYAGQAALLLDQRALGASAQPPYPFDLTDGASLVDLRPAVRAIVDDLDAGLVADVVAARFVETLASAVLALCRAARKAGAPSTVALTGGAFVHRRLAERTRLLLEGDGFEVLRHRRIPPNDNGISLGQAAIVAAR